MTSTDQPSRSLNKDAPQKVPLATSVRNFFTRTGKQVHRQVNRFTEYVGLRKDAGMSSSNRRALAQAEGSEISRMGPEVKRALRISLRVGAGILAAVVTVKVGGALTGGGKGKKKNRGVKEQRVRPGVRMSEDMSKKAQAAAKSVEQAVAAASGSVAKAAEGAKTAATNTKDACVKTRDSCLKATSEAKKAAAETKAICDAALEGAKQYIKESNEKKRKEAEKWTEQQPKRKQRSSQAQVAAAPQELTEPMKTLEFMRDLLAERVERVYFHVFP